MREERILVYGAEGSQGTPVARQLLEGSLGRNGWVAFGKREVGV